MAFPNHQASGTAQSVGAAAMTAPWGTHSADDVAFFPMEGASAPGLATANGFAQAPDAPQSATASFLDLYWCRATGSAQASPVTNAFANHGHGLIVTFRGVVATGDPWDVTSGGVEDVSDTTLSATGDTTTGPERLVVFFVGRGFDSAAAQFSAESCAGVSNLTKIYDAGTATGNGGGLGIWTAELATAGAYGPLLATLANASVKEFISVALKPAAGGTTFQVSVGGSVTATGALVRKTKLTRAGTSTGSGALIRKIRKTLPGSTTVSGVLTKRIRKLFTGSITGSGSISLRRIFPRTFTGSITPTGLLTRRTRKTLAGSSTATGSLTKRTRKLLTGSVTPTGTLAAIRKFIRNLTGSITPTGALRLKAGKRLGGSITPAGSLNSRTRKTLSGSVAGSGALTLRRVVRRAFAGSITAVGSLTSQVVSGFVGWWRRVATAFTRNPVAYTKNPVDYDPAEGDQPSPF